ncbi:MAG: hypothetical protein OWU33_09345 [Firmicutes bacterium]|nr:hypothetical protein [Bacillota bacterium]
MCSSERIKKTPAPPLRHLLEERSGFHVAVIAPGSGSREWSGVRVHFG